MTLILVIGVVAGLISFAIGYVVGAYRMMLVPDLEKAFLKEENARLKCMRSFDRLGHVVNKAQEKGLL